MYGDEKKNARLEAACRLMRIQPCDAPHVCRAIGEKRLSETTRREFDLYMAWTAARAAKGDGE